MRMYTSNQYPYVRGPLRECRSIRSGASGLPYYCAPLVCVSEVIELLAVWRHNEPKLKTSLNRDESTKFHEYWMPLILMILKGIKAQFVLPYSWDLGVSGASILQISLSCLVDLNSYLYHLYCSLGLDTFWAQVCLFVCLFVCWNKTRKCILRG